MSIALYEQLTAGRTRFLRVDELCRLASEKGTLPSVSDLAAEAGRPLREKQGLERMEQIKFAVLERSGAISIVPRQP